MERRDRRRLARQADKRNPGAAFAAQEATRAALRAPLIRWVRLTGATNAEHLRITTVDAVNALGENVTVTLTATIRPKNGPTE